MSSMTALTVTTKKWHLHKMVNRVYDFDILFSLLRRSAGAI
ncbi:hypothetical protein XBO1_680011 [Xenorhabdus bovienii str. oregonense]|uniref:Uncharacterized protein n=1 Tax=Xenorhabdus bovienii str. oregonense TaxID=1398202 RepID=A0A077PDV3_XENBV|nr:hypothetical protein XBO1_680011 [Xenorhabdus bovienii str. oregonense]